VELVADKDTTIRHLRQLLLPAATEKTKDVLAKAGVEAAAPAEPPAPDGAPEKHHRVALGPLGPFSNGQQRSISPA
jgi:hypothetical protein